MIEHMRKHDSLCCIKCKKVFKNRLSAYKHCVSHPAPYVECEICGHKVKPRYLPDHRKKKHTKGVPKKFYTCSICNKSYADHTAMRVHYSQKHKEMGIDVSVVCDVCGKRLSCRDKLIKHQRSHNGHMPYVCKICERGFAQNATLEGHMRTHTGEKPFVCIYCGKKFAHGTPYRYHVKTHTGEKQFSCDFCGKMFIARSNMKVHMKTCSPINRC